VLLFAGLLTASTTTAGPAIGPVLVIGLDGLERRVVDAMWAEGYLPNLQTLASEGLIIALETADRSRERPVWTTVATGRSSEHHGITKNVFKTSGRGSIGAGSGQRQVPALWNIAHQNGLTSFIAGWPATFPAESIAGTILSDRASIEQGTEAASPPKVAASLTRWARIAESELGHLFPGSRDGAQADRLAFWATLQSLGAEQADLTMVWLRRVDRTSHRLWKYFEPEQYETTRELGWEYEAREFYESYVAVDAAVGQLVAAAVPGTRILVLSAHGFKGIEESSSLRCNLTPVLEYLGYLNLYAGEPEWRQTSLYVVDSPDASPRKQVRVNLRGREPKGRVRSNQRQALIAELTASLALFEYAGTQTPVFRVEAPGQGDSGDVVVIFNEIGVGTTLESGANRIEGAMITFNRKSGGHGRDTPGLLIAWGPGIASGKVALEASVLDITPTVLRLLGVPDPDALEGRVLEDTMEPGWLTEHPVVSPDHVDP
jgi:predicted AlkP superfamily phosphohydrolase/phosphomutase